MHRRAGFTASGRSVRKGSTPPDSKARVPLPGLPRSTFRPPGQADLARLAERIQSGDANAESEFVELFAPKVLSLVRSRVRDRDLACEIVDDVLMAVLLALRKGRVKDTQHLGGFVIGTARHLVENRLRRRCRRRDTEPLERDCGCEESLAAYERADQIRIVRLASAHLGPVEQQILTLTLDEGLTPSEIATRLGLPVECIRQKKCRAVRRISALLNPR